MERYESIANCSYSRRLKVQGTMDWNTMEDYFNKGVRCTSHYLILRLLKEIYRLSDTLDYSALIDLLCSQ
jgi:hypothetical protein